MPKPPKPPGKPDKPPGKPVDPVDPPTEPPIEPPTEPPATGVDPELPRVYVDTTYVPPTGATIRLNAGGNLQAALNNAQPGDCIALERGATFPASLVLPPKSGAGYIHVETDGFAMPGRVVPSGALASILATSSYPAINTSPGAHHFRFVGVNIGAPGTDIDTLVMLGDSEDPDLADQPHHIIFDRCAIRGDATLGGKRGLSLQGSYLAVIDSYVDGWKRVGQDSQAIAGWNGAGPFKIANNFIEGAGENVMFGGSDARVANLTPSDIEIRGNHFFKPLTWKLDDPSYAGVNWRVKNLLELKHARRVLIEGNLLENCWADGQVGFAVVFTGRNQSGSNPWACLEDITFQANEIRTSANSINMLGQDFESGVPSAISKRLRIAHNLGSNIGFNPGNDGIAFQIIWGYEDVNIDHNTVLHRGNTLITGGAPSPRLRFTNNIAQHNDYGIKGDNQGPGNSTIAVYFPDSVVTRNVLATPAEPGMEALYPPENYFPPTLEDIGFVGYPSDLHLAPTSPYAGMATDGTNLGY